MPFLVVAEDKDSGENARLVYTVSDFNFTVNDRGEISARNRLDADQNRERFYIYRFNVTVTDKGDPPLNATALVSFHWSELLKYHYGAIERSSCSW